MGTQGNASGNVKLIVGGVLVLALIGAVIYMDRAASPNLGTMMLLLGSTVSGLLAYLKAGQVQQVQQGQQATVEEIHEKVNGSYARAQAVASEALGELEPERAQEVLRRVEEASQQPPPEEPKAAP